MYISKIKINGFRSFKDCKILFNKDINIIIGANNSGKTNLLKALALVIDPNTSKRLSIFDFNHSLTFADLENPPEIKITLTLAKRNSEESDIDSLAMVAKWLVRLEDPFEAQLTYSFHLPLKERQAYKDFYDKVKNNKNTSSKDRENELWKYLDKFFLRKYVAKIYGGLMENQYIAEPDTLGKFDFQFLDAIRDVERDMLSGKSKLLKEVLEFFIDYDIKHNDAIGEKEKKEMLLEKEDIFETSSKKLISSIRDRLNKGKTKIFEYEKEFGSSGKVSFDGDLTEAELFSFLGLVIEKAGISLPATHNGLGYNNLIFMALVLAKMQVDSDGNYLGSNAKSYPILVVEEPEAHLHPSMQYKLIESFNKNLSEGKTKQIFITSHSPNITAKAELENIICLEHNFDLESIKAAYPTKVFPATDDGIKSRKYVQRFLDVTRSDLLFANRIILVEGIAEELLMHTFARYLNMDLTSKHIAIINVGGRYFEHFLYLFDGNEDTKEYVLSKKIAFLTDRDHMRLEIDVDTQSKGCYPFEHNIDEDKYTYSFNPHISQEGYMSNIKCFTQIGNSSTFEYDLIMHNPSLKLLLTDSMKNVSELTKLMEMFDEQKSLKELSGALRDSDANKRIIAALDDNRVGFLEEDKKKHLIAARYLNSVSKGEHALDLQYALEENLLKKDKYDLVIPQYIQDALGWIYCD